MNLKTILIAAGAIAIASAASLKGAPTDPRSFAEEARRKARENTVKARSDARAITDSARAKANRYYSEALLKKWKAASAKAPVEPSPLPLPLPEEPVDTIVPSEDYIIQATELPQSPEPIINIDPLFDFGDLDLSPVLTIGLPESNKTPADSEPDAEPATEPQGSVRLEFYGVPLTLPTIEASRLKIGGTSEQSVSSAWQLFSEVIPNSVIASLQRVREELELCDWAYLKFADQYLSESLTRESNEWAVALANVMNRSGLDMRLARTQSEIIPVIGTEYVIYYRSYYPEGRLNFITYPEKRTIQSMCDAHYPKVRPFALDIPREMKFAQRLSDPRPMKSKRYPDVKAEARVNLNLIDFYNDFPAAQYSDQTSTHWAMRAATPVSQAVRESLYPGLQSALSGLSEREAADRLLNFVQTSLVYDYDSNVWGEERSFFPEETVFYPYADCEDRSALFVALVRDLLGLDAALVIYPDHVATAVGFTEDQSGDAVMLNGRKFVICDPTYIGVPTGRMMPQMRGVAADVILVK